MRVVPEESERRSDHGAAEDRKLARLGDVRDLEIPGGDRVSADVGEKSVRPGRDPEGADRQAVQAVRQVHGIGRTDEHRGDERDVERPEVDDQALEEWKRDERRERARRRPVLDRPGGGERDQELREQLSAARQSEAAPAGELHEVVGETDDSDADQGSESDPHQPIRQVHPEERGENHRQQDENPSHRRSSRFREMGAGTVLADGLPDLAPFQKPDRRHAERERQEERRDRRHRRAERDVPEDVERREDLRERIQPPVEHSGLGRRASEHFHGAIQADGVRPLEENHVAFGQHAIEQARRFFRRVDVRDRLSGKAEVDRLLAVVTRELPHADEVVGAAGSILADFPVPDVLVRSELAHVAENSDAPRRRKAREGVEGGPERGRVRVVRIVVEERARTMPAEFPAMG